MDVSLCVCVVIRCIWSLKVMFVRRWGVLIIIRIVVIVCCYCFVDEKMVVMKRLIGIW